MMKIFRLIKEKLSDFKIRRAKKSGLADDSLFFKGVLFEQAALDSYPKVIGADDERPDRYSFVYKHNKRLSDD